MTHWDGLLGSTSEHPPRILVLGATNRIQDIDEAILRRLPKRFSIELPDAPQRRNILELVLKDTKLDASGEFSMNELVKRTAGMSGSDLKEACRDAAMVPIREYIKEKKAKGEQLQGVRGEEIRGIRDDDFFRKKSGITLGNSTSFIIDGIPVD